MKSSDLLAWFKDPFRIKDQETSIAYDNLIASDKIPLENPSKLIAHRGLSLFDKMRKDDQIKSAMNFKKGSVISTGWHIQSPPGKPDDWEVSEFVRYNFEHMVGTLEDKIWEILTALDYGFSVTEKIFGTLDEGPFKNKVAIADLKTRRPHGFKFYADDYGNLTRITQESGFKETELDPMRFVVFTYQQEFQNFYGQSDLESAFPYWWAKTNAYKWLSMYLEKLGIPPMIALFNPDQLNKKSQDDLLTHLKNLQAASVGIIPRPTKDDLELWTPQANLNVVMAFEPALTRYNLDISRSLLMPNLIGLSEEGSQGSFARAAVQFDVFVLVLNKLRNQIENSVMQECIIKPLVDLNYNVDEYPQFKFNPITEEQRFDILERWENLVDKKVVQNTPDDERHIRALLSFPDREMNEEEKQNPDKKDDGDSNDDKDNEKQSDNKHVSGYGQFALNRTPNKIEKKVDFKSLAEDIDDIELSALPDLIKEVKAIKKHVTGFVNTNFDNNPIQTLQKITVGSTDKFGKVVGRFLKKAFSLGRQRARKEVKGESFAGNVGVEPKEALKWLEALELEITGGFSRALLQDIKFALLNAIKYGDTLAETIQRLDEVFQKYLGDEVDEQRKPYRLETIVRTNTTAAMNQGRLVQIRQSSEFVQGVMYSAIIDSRTSPVCEHLDGRVFKTGDSDLDVLTPPNHHNCRSVLVPVLIDEKVDRKQRITSAQKGRAKDLAGKGFV